LQISFEYNVGIAGIQNGLGQTRYQFSFQWSLERSDYFGLSQAPPPRKIARLSFAVAF
jgi:hypothetical protein